MVGRRDARHGVPDSRRTRPYDDGTRRNEQPRSQPARYGVRPAPRADPEADRATLWSAPVRSPGGRPAADSAIGWRGAAGWPGT